MRDVDENSGSPRPSIAGPALTVYHLWAYAAVMGVVGTTAYRPTDALKPLALTNDLGPVISTLITASALHAFGLRYAFSVSPQRSLAVGCGIGFFWALGVAMTGAFNFTVRLAAGVFGIVIPVTAARTLRLSWRSAPGDDRFMGLGLITVFGGLLTMMGVGTILSFWSQN